MIRRVLKKIDRLNADKTKLITEQSKLQKKIDDIDNEIKNYTTLKKDYEKLQRKFNDLMEHNEDKKNE